MFYNSHGIEILGREENATPPAPLIATATNHTTINTNTIPVPIDLSSTIDKAKDNTVTHNTPLIHVFTCDNDVHSTLPTILEEVYPLLDEPNLCDLPQVVASPVVNPSQTIDIGHGIILPVTTVKFSDDINYINDDNTTSISR